MKFAVALCLIAFASLTSGSGCRFYQREAEVTRYLQVLAKEGGPKYSLVNVTDVDIDFLNGYYITIAANLKDEAGNIKYCKLLTAHNLWKRKDKDGLFFVDFDCAEEEPFSQYFNYTDIFS